MIRIMSNELRDLFLNLSPRRQLVRRGTTVFCRGDRVTSVFMVDDGAVLLQRAQESGTVITLQRAEAGDVLAEASVYAKTYHCDAVVSDDARLLVVRRRHFLTQLTSNTLLAELWATHLAKTIQSARAQVDILSRGTVAARLDGWMAWKDRGLPPKGEWKSLAEDIGVTPEALYREIARRRRSSA